MKKISIFERVEKNIVEAMQAQTPAKIHAFLAKIGCKKKHHRALALKAMIAQGCSHFLFAPAPRMMFAHPGSLAERLNNGLWQHRGLGLATNQKLTIKPQPRKNHE